MKHFGLAAVMGLAVILTGCGTTRSVMSNTSTVKNPQMQAFFGFGDVIQTADGIQLTVSSDTVFRKDSRHLSGGGIAKVDSIAAAILKYPGDKVLVVVYEGQSGTGQKNSKFSQHRADTIRKELIKDGMGAVNVNAEGISPLEPTSTNDTGTEAKNHKIEFEISAL